MKWFSSFILRKAGLVSFLGILFALAGAYYSVLLYMNLRTEIQELLPTTARSVVDLKEVTERLQSIESMSVLVFSQHPAASKKFVIDLAEKLNQFPKTTIASVEYKIDLELKFFKERQALYMDLSDLIRIKNYIRDRIEYEKSLYNPLNLFESEDLPEPKLDFLALKTKYKSRGSQYEKMPAGFYATPDETKRAVIVYLPGSANGIQGAQRLKNAVEKSITSLKPTSYASDLEVKLTGGVEDSIEEQTALVEDLELSTGIVTVIVTVAMLFFYRAFRATLALLLSLFVGTLWTFGLSYFVVGYLNANSAFLGSIVIGNGINFGIIYLARYLEERRSGRNNLRATRIAMLYTATSTWTAALAAALSYGSLMLTGFRGFRQFGVIGLMGMILCWVSAFTVLPAFITLLDKIRPIVKKGSHPPKPILAGALAWTVGKFPRTIWGLSIAITLFSISTFFNYHSNLLETDLTKLRNKESMTQGSGYFSKYIDEIFQRFLSPLAILPHTRENADKIAAALRRRQALDGKNSLIASVQTLNDFLPKEQLKKIEVLKQIKKLLPIRLLHRLSPGDQKLVNEFLTVATLKPIREQDLPPLILNKFTEKDGTRGKMVLVEPPVADATRNGESLMQFIETVRSVTDSIEAGAPVAGTIALSSDMVNAISHDGPRATLFAFIAVIILVILLFRNVKTISLVLFSLGLGVIWLAGLILGLKFKINFLNFIALPITFGIGVDYGVNIFQRFRETPDENILNVIRSTGSAVGLCSLSTIVGYTSLLIARNQGFVSFGVLAVAGELTCVIAALISLPAFLTLRSRRNRVRNEEGS